MNSDNYVPASKEQLAREALLWDSGSLRPDDWIDAPEAVPRSGAATPISIRVPTQMLAVLKAFAKREGIGYQVLMKRWLDERIREEHSKLSTLEEEGAVHTAVHSEDTTRCQ